MRVLVCGSRDFGDPDAARTLIANRLLLLWEQDPDAVVIHGGAPGTDMWCDFTCYQLALETEVWKADWERYGKPAGMIRNLAMLNSGVELVIAFWNGFSRGTLHTITEARKRGIEVEVIELEPAVV